MGLPLASFSSAPVGPGSETEAAWTETRRTGGRTRAKIGPCSTRLLGLGVGERLKGERIIWVVTVFGSIGRLAVAIEGKKSAGRQAFCGSKKTIWSTRWVPKMSRLLLYVLEVQYRDVVRVV